MAVGKTRKKLNAKASRSSGNSESTNSLKIKVVVLRNPLDDTLTAIVVESDYPGVTFTASYNDYAGGLFDIAVTASTASVINTSTVLIGYNIINDQQTLISVLPLYQASGVAQVRNINVPSAIEDAISHTIGSTFEIINLI